MLATRVVKRPPESRITTSTHWSAGSRNGSLNTEPLFCTPSANTTSITFVWLSPFHEDDVKSLADLVGAENLIMGSDWPHAEGMRTPTDYARELQELEEAEIQTIMRDNGLSLITPRPQSSA